MEFVDVLAVHAAATPRKPAVIDGERSIDFESLNWRANQAGILLLGLDCGVHDRVA